jgi:4-hydroxybenzoate polyprenyltransferase
MGRLQTSAAYGCLDGGYLVTSEHHDHAKRMVIEGVPDIVPGSKWQRLAWALLVAARPRQWLKNGLVFLALFFSVGEAWQVQDPGTWLPLLSRAVLASLAFCAVSSAGYLINDVTDADRDRIHPVKRHRPITSGELSPRCAVMAAGVSLAIGLGLGSILGWPFVIVLVAYSAISLAYSAKLKHVVIVDLFILASGFVLRAVAGAVAIGVRISPWLYLCTLLGALFLVMTKRRYELTMLDADAGRHRSTLSNYTVELLDQMIMITSASTVVSYAVYTVTASNVPTNGAMLATVPILLYGMFHYLYLIHRGGMGGSPEEVLLKDRPTQLAVALWIASSLVILALWRT